jgi:hypothetical protein
VAINQHFNSGEYLLLLALGDKTEKPNKISHTYFLLTVCVFFFAKIYSHKKNKKNNADTSLQERRQEKHMLGWL